MKRIRVCGISGSLGKDSYNRKALKIALKFAEKFDAVVKVFDLKKSGLPIYDEDVEKSGFPPSVVDFKKAVGEANVLLIASPEYNHSISGALKNAIDWLSRGNNSLDGKTAAIFGVSSGNFGTVRGQTHLRQILAALGVMVLPQPQVFIRNARDSFDPDGSLKDEKTLEQLELLVKRTLKEAEKR